ncbi:MAG TPA: SGNH/GDSL hydrolase family protein [Methylomirabilota bacterium]|nr:SGNH/GDSL hydrolase family protein [Methylomirabilota bacterium]
MTGVLAVAVTAAALLAGCGWSRAASPRTLPADRNAEVHYVAVGDSTVEGVGASSPELTYVARLGARLREVYPRAVTTNLGVGGATSADVLRRQLDRAVALRPALVTMSIGPNDITTGVRVERYERNVEAILRRLDADTTALVVVNLLPDLAITPRFRGKEKEALVGGLTVRFNDALARQARAHGAALVDLYTASRTEVPARPDLVGADGYHPSDDGYERWAALMWEAVEARVER